MGAAAEELSSGERDNRPANRKGNASENRSYAHGISDNAGKRYKGAGNKGAGGREPAATRMDSSDVAVFTAYSPFRLTSNESHEKPFGRRSDPAENKDGLYGASDNAGKQYRDTERRCLSGRTGAAFYSGADASTAVRYVAVNATGTNPGNATGNDTETGNDTGTHVSADAAATGGSSGGIYETKQSQIAAEDDASSTVLCDGSRANHICGRTETSSRSG